MQRREFLKQGASLLTIGPLMNTKAVRPLIASSEVVQTSVGNLQCRVFLDSMFKYLAKDFFINAQPDELNSLLQRHTLAPDNIPSPFIATLIQAGDRKILLDTGVGFTEKPVHVRGKPVVFKGRLHALLIDENIRKEEITDVIITHCHPDHIGGIFSEDGNINFPHAAFYIHEDEWNYWHSAASANQPDQFRYFIEKNVTPLKGFNLHLVKGDFVDLFPGITVVKADGHTPGQMAIIATSNKEHLLYISDAMLHPIHIEKIDWQTNYDLDHQQAKRSRLKLLDLAFRDNMLVNAFHFDFPGLGRIDKMKNGWSWRSWSRP